MTRLVVATRKSQLALAQARAWMRSLESAVPGLELAELLVTTTGDRIQDRALSEIGGKGLFIKEIEEAVLAADAQLAIHSMKDVPAELAPGLEIACIPLREDPRDVAITRSGAPLADLPPGSKVGTSSLRRKVQLEVHRPDLEFVPLRGNVDTRIKKLHAGEIDAVILAHAGIRRLGRAAEVTEVLDATVCLPAVGQGALAIEIASSDATTREIVGRVADPETTLRVAAERGVMVAVEGNCQIPVGAYALRDEGELWLRGMLAEVDGSRLRRCEVRVPWPESPTVATQVGLELGRQLKGA